jgi:adenosine 3'-phospho 5'-phosphosulfate transporter B3
MQHKDDEFYLFAIPLHNYTKKQQLGIIVAGIFVVFLSFFLIHEFIFKLEGFEYSGVQTMIMFSVAACFAFAEHVYKGEKRQGPIIEHAILALFSALSVAFGAYSLLILNFPTWVLFKSARIIFVMIGAILIMGKKFNLLEYASAVNLFLGLVLFTLGDMEVHPKFQTLGVILVVLALVCDAFIGNYSERLLQKFKATRTETIAYPYAIGACFLLVFLGLFGRDELIGGLSFYQKNPFILTLTLLNSTLNYIGLVFIMALLKVSDAFTVVFVTSLRKAVTILLSFVLFAKPLSVFYLVGSIFVANGIYLDIRSARERAKYHKESNEQNNV